LHYLTVAAPGWVFIPPNYRSIINCNYQDYTLIDSTKVGFSQSSVSPGGHTIIWLNQTFPILIPNNINNSIN